MHKGKTARRTTNSLANWKTILALIAGLATLAACETGATGDGDDNGGDTEPGINAFVGSGYDVFDEYANASKVKAAVLDYDSMVADGMIEFIPVNSSTFEVIEGTTSTEYLSNFDFDMGVSAGAYGFSASIGANYSESEYTSSTYAFSTIQAKIYKNSLRIKPDEIVSGLRGYLTDNARAAIDGTDEEYSDPRQLFNVFGTHVLGYVVLGGRLDYTYGYDMSQVDASWSVGAYAQAAYESINANAGFSASVSNEESLSSFSENSKKKLTLMGGGTEFGFSITDLSDYSEWAGSFSDSETWTLCDFHLSSGSQGLIPIWTLCEDDARKQELMDYFKNEWVTERALPDIDYVPSPRGTLTVKLYYLYNNDISDNVGGESGGNIDVDWTIYGKVNGGTATEQVLHTQTGTTIQWPPTQFIALQEGTTAYQVTTSEPATYVSKDFAIDTTQLTSSAGEDFYITMEIRDSDGDDNDYVLDNGHQVFWFSYDQATDTWTSAGVTVTNNDSVRYTFRTGYQQADPVGTVSVGRGRPEENIWIRGQDPGVSETAIWDYETLKVGLLWNN